MAKFTDISGGITWTMTSLLAGERATSDAYDNTVTQYDSILFTGTTKTTAGTSATGDLRMGYLFSMDNTHWPPQADILDIQPVNQSTSYTLSGTISPAPLYFKMTMLNRSGQALSATGGDHSFKVYGVYTTAKLNTTTATAAFTHVSLTSSAGIIVAANTSRNGIMIKNNDGANVCYIGKDNTVSSSNGYLLKTGEEMIIQNPAPSTAFWGVSASGAVVSVMEW